MATHHHCSELLLFSNTVFSQKQIVGKGNKEEPTKTFWKKLEDACREGIIPELLPEVVSYTFCNKKIVSWEMLPGKCFVHISSVHSSLNMEGHYSINPHIFISRQSYN